MIQTCQHFGIIWWLLGDANSDITKVPSGERRSATWKDLFYFGILFLFVHMPALGKVWPEVCETQADSVLSGIKQKSDRFGCAVSDCVRTTERSKSPPLKNKPFPQQGFLVSKWRGCFKSRSWPAFLKYSLYSTNKQLLYVNVQRLQNATKWIITDYITQLVLYSNDGCYSAAFLIFCRGGVCVDGPSSNPRTCAFPLTCTHKHCSAELGCGTETCCTAASPDLSANI